jgi:DNA-binding HxlR family transcriptional regulator
MSSSVLRTRLLELVEQGLVKHNDDGYGLTPMGDELGDAVRPLTGWAERWQRHLSVK